LGNSSNRINLGYVHARRENAEEAARAFRRVEESTEGRRSPTTTAGLAYGYWRIGYATEAKSLFEQIQNAADERSIGAGTWVVAYLAIGARSERWKRSMVCSKKSRSRVGRRMVQLDAHQAQHHRRSAARRAAVQAATRPNTRELMRQKCSAIY
jgi:hypothetical protein